jgi:chemotaxis protein methyltransferase CheR
MLQTDSILSDEEFQWISDLVHKHCGINLHQGKKELVRARLAKRLRVGGFATVRAYLDHMLVDETGAEFTEFIDSLSTNLTSFYRESTHFDYLRDVYLPHLAEAGSRQGTRSIRAWSAACSSGEEPYTMAITLLEQFGPQAGGTGGAGGWDVRVLATDISTRVLRLAEAGIYDRKRVEPVPQALKTRYLVANRIEGEQVFQVGQALRDIVRFRHLNLMNPWPFTGPFDVIFCRNVMIYFDKPTQQRLVNRFCEILSPGGLLFTGHSESLTGISHRLRYVQPTIYARP